MAVFIFTRCSYFRRFISIANNAAFLSSNAAQHSKSESRAYATSVNDVGTFGSVNKPVKNISKAMLAYLQRAKEHDEFMKKEVMEYKIGKRHLANMMGEDPECFTQEDINRSIEYLFPSGLFDPKARPIMRHPEEIFPSRKAAEFDETGRPYHSMFYTSKPNYYEALYDIVENVRSLNNIEDSVIRQGILPDPTDKIDLVGSTWLPKLEIENLLLENIKDTEYDYLITSLERLCDHPLSKRAMDFIMKFRKMLIKHINEIVIPPLEYDSTGRPYITVKNCMRKSSRGTLTIWGKGSGKIAINGHDISYFKYFHHREQIIFPLIFTDMAYKVDIEAAIQGGGPTGQSGAMRWGIAWGLRSFVDKPMVEKMRIAGLLTKDWRKRERKKWGQEGARRKFTWKKR